MFNAPIYYCYDNLSSNAMFGALIY